MLTFGFDPGSGWCVSEATVCSVRWCMAWSGGHRSTAAWIQTVLMKLCSPARFALESFLQVRHTNTSSGITNTDFIFWFLVEALSEVPKGHRVVCGRPEEINDKMLLLVSEKVPEDFTEVLLSWKTLNCPWGGFWRGLWRPWGSSRDPWVLLLNHIWFCFF